MSNFFGKLVVAMGAILFVGAIAVLSGTLIWVLWPWAIPAVFPGLVASGVIAGKLGWGASVCLSWLFGLLLKSSVTVNH